VVEVLRSRTTLVPLLVTASGFEASFKWAIALSHTETDEAHPCCVPFFPTLVAEHPSACHAVQGAAAFLLTALYGLALTALTPLMLLVGSLLLAIIKCRKYPCSVAFINAMAALISAGMAIPFITLMCFYAMGAVIAAHMKK
jgi:hypothetical protein